MTEEHNLVGGVKIHAVIQPHRRRYMLIIQPDNLPGQPPAIEPVGQHIDTGRRDDKPEPIYFLVWIDDADDVGKR